MEKKIEDYLHLYLGCDVAIEGQKNAILGAVGIRNNEMVIVRWVDEEWSYADVKEVKPILRLLSAMSEEEKLHIVVNITYNHVKFSSKESAMSCFEPDRYTNKYNNELYPEETLYLLKQGFDLFDLIPSNLALDKTKL